jgi:Holliday junction resolvase RusA-like endonuclease
VAPIKRPDVDGLVHKLTDQFNGVFWHDDSQIIDFVISKRYAPDGRSGVSIIVAPAYLGTPEAARVPVQGEIVTR